jgi:hypothetical protein
MRRRRCQLRPRRLGRRPVAPTATPTATISIPVAWRQQITTPVQGRVEVAGDGPRRIGRAEWSMRRTGIGLSGRHHTGAVSVMSEPADAVSRLIILVASAAAVFLCSFAIGRMTGASVTTRDELNSPQTLQALSPQFGIPAALSAAPPLPTLVTPVVNPAPARSKRVAVTVSPSTAAAETAPAPAAVQSAPATPAPAPPAPAPATSRAPATATSHNSPPGGGGGGGLFDSSG